MKYIKKLIYVLLLAVATQVATAQIKILYGPYLQNVKENEATIVWVADKPSIGWVELAPNDGTHYYGEERPKYFDTTNGVKKYLLAACREGKSVDSRNNLSLSYLFSGSVVA